MKMKALAGLITALFIASMLSTAYADTTVNLLADQTEPVGTVTVSNDATNLYVTYSIDTVNYPDLCLIELHLAVNTSLSDIPQTGSSKGPNPKTGHFPYQEPWSPPAAEDQTPTAHTFTIPLASITGYTEFGDTFYIAAQADVGQWGWLPGPDEILGNEDDVWGVVFEETAWGSGTDFGGRNWAMYFTYDTVEPPP